MILWTGPTRHAYRRAEVSLAEWLFRIFLVLVAVALGLGMQANNARMDERQAVHEFEESKR